MEDAHAPTTTQPSLIADEALRTTPDSQLAARLNELNTGLLGSVQIAVSAGSMSVLFAVAMGQVLEEEMRRHEGEFAQWLETVIARDEEGKPRLSETTALRYRTLWRRRDLIFPVDGSMPTARNLTDAYQKVGILPEPDPARGNGKDAPFFRLAFAAPATPISLWPPKEIRAFLHRTEHIAELRVEAAKMLS